MRLLLIALLSIGTVSALSDPAWMSFMQYVMSDNATAPPTTAAPEDRKAWKDLRGRLAAEACCPEEHRKCCEEQIEKSEPLTCIAEEKREQVANCIQTTLHGGMLNTIHLGYSHIPCCSVYDDYMRDPRGGCAQTCRHALSVPSWNDRLKKASVSRCMRRNTMYKCFDQCRKDLAAYKGGLLGELTEPFQPSNYCSMAKKKQLIFYFQVEAQVMEFEESVNFTPEQLEYFKKMADEEDRAEALEKRKVERANSKSLRA